MAKAAALEAALATALEDTDQASVVFKISEAALDRKSKTTQVFLDLKLSPESVEVVFQLPDLQLEVAWLEVPWLQALEVQGASVVSTVVKVSQVN